MKKLFFLLLLLVGIVIAPVTYGLSFLHISGGQAPIVVQSIASLTPTSFVTAGAANTTIGTIAVNMSPMSPIFSGTCSLTGANASLFAINSTTCQVSNGSTNNTPGTYSALTVTATPTNVQISPRSQSLTITVNAPGTLVTTATIANISGVAWTPNQPYIGGQGFRRGDVLAASNCVQIKDASNHAPLVYQLDEIATRRENSDDGSIRHLVYSFLFPATSPQYTGSQIAAGGTFQIEFDTTGATCVTGTQHQSLAAYCAAHDIKLSLTDVRNQDGTIRGPAAGPAGTLTFDTCANINNVGRDAPLHLAQGPVRDLWVIRGPPVYGNGAKDPLLYVTCYLDVTTLLNGSTIGPLRHVCAVHNSWMNVKANSAGNAGAPGPVGLGDGTTGPAGGGTAGSTHGDPQAVTYRPQLLDGSTNVLDYSWWDGSVSAASNPINTAGTAYPPAPTSADCAQTQSTNYVGTWNIAASNASNPWYFGMSVYPSTSGTAPTGMTFNNANPALQTNEVLYSVMNWGETTGTSAAPFAGSNFVMFESTPYPCGTGHFVQPTTQGTGTHSFSFRVYHWHYGTWYTLDQSGLENWTSGGTNISTTGENTNQSLLLPKFTSTEWAYWRQTGTVPPLVLGPNTCPLPDPTFYTGTSSYPLYQPFGRGLLIGGGATGVRPDIGIVSEFMSHALLCNTAIAWQRARVFAYNYALLPNGSSLLNEATGHIPAVNNGPPDPTTHAGTGVSYAVLGAPFPSTTLLAPILSNKVVDPLTSVPISGGDTADGYINGIIGPGATSFGNDHNPSAMNGMYQILGSRHYLDATYFMGNRVTNVLSFGGGLGTGTSASANTDQLNDGINRYGLYYGQIGGRPMYWSMRDISVPAYLGGDNDPTGNPNIERQYFFDRQIENYFYGEAWYAQLDGTSNNIRNNLLNPLVISQNAIAEGFMDAYGVQTAWGPYAMAKDRMAKRWLDTWARQINLRCNGAAGNVSQYFCIQFVYDPQVHDMSLLTGYPTNVGAAYNGTDTSDDGDAGNGVGGTNYVFAAGSPTITVNNEIGDRIWANGDTVKWGACTVFNLFCGMTAANTVDQFASLQGTWLTVSSVASVGGQGTGSWTFKVNCPANYPTPGDTFCPTVGQPFTQYTHAGAGFSHSNFAEFGDPFFKVRHFTGPSTGYASSSYLPYIEAWIYGLNSLGYTAQMAPLYTMLTNRGTTDACSFQIPVMNCNLSWDPNLTVP